MAIKILDSKGSTVDIEGLFICKVMVGESQETILCAYKGDVNHKLEEVAIDNYGRFCINPAMDELDLIYDADKSNKNHLYFIDEDGDSATGYAVELRIYKTLENMKKFIFPIMGIDGDVVYTKTTGGDLADPIRESISRFAPTESTTLDVVYKLSREILDSEARGEYNIQTLTVEHDHGKTVFEKQGIKVGLNNQEENKNNKQDIDAFGGVVKKSKLNQILDGDIVPEDDSHLYMLKSKVKQSKESSEAA